MTLTPVETSDTRLELIGRITAGLAHELSGPLGIAIGFAELAKDTLSSGNSGADAETVSKVSQYLGLIENSSRRARDLSRAISEFAKAKPGTVEEFDLAKLVSQAALLSNPAVKSGLVEIVAGGGQAAQEVIVTADRAVILHAMVRLMLSSTDALSGGGTVRWEAHSKKGAGKFVLTGEPSAEPNSQGWPVEEAVREAFESQGGSVSPALSEVLSGKGGPDAVAAALIITGTLPVVAG